MHLYAMTIAWYGDSGHSVSRNISNAQEILAKATKDTGIYRIYAKHTPIYFIVIYDGNQATGGITKESVTRSIRDYIPLSKNGYNRTGYRFDGWKTQADGTVVEFTDQEPIGYINNIKDGVVVLYAHWVPISYTINFDDDNGNATVVGNSQKTVTFDQAYGELPNCTKKGHTFIGWYTSKYGGTKVENIDTMNIPENHTLYPHFEAIKYTISFINNSGTTIASQTVSFGTTITLTNPKHTYGSYYTFAGWTDNTYTYSETYTVVEDKDIVLTAKWNQTYADYTYIFTADDFKWHIGNNLQKSSKPNNCGAGKYMLLNDINLGDWNEGWGYTYWASNNESTTLNAKTCFTGVFDGQNHTITYKLRVGKTNLQSWAFGLFPVTDGATIKNLKVKADLSTYDPQNRGKKWHISNDDRAEDAMVGGLIGCEKYNHRKL